VNGVFEADDVERDALWHSNSGSICDDENRVFSEFQVSVLLREMVIVEALRSSSRLAFMYGPRTTATEDLSITTSRTSVQIYSALRSELEVSVIHRIRRRRNTYLPTLLEFFLANTTQTHPLRIVLSSNQSTPIARILYAPRC
jgi:hypothetical protein